MDHEAARARAGDRDHPAISIASTFRWMQLRKLERARGGIVQKPNWMLRFFWLCAVAGLWAGLATLDWNHGAIQLQLSIRLSTSVLVSLAVMVVVLFLIVKVVNTLHIALYWVYATFLVAVYVVLAKDPESISSSNRFAECIKREAYAWGIAALATLEALTLLTFLCWSRVVPGLLSSASDAWIIWLFSIRSSGDAADVGSGCEFTFALPWSPYRFTFPLRRRVCRVFYSGGLRGGKPHGYGEWRDDSKDGECLRGFWAEGYPIGPYFSRIFKSGFSFSALRVGFATARAERCEQSPFCVPRRHAHVGLRFGVASVECSVAGFGFWSYPRHELLWETPQEDLDASILSPEQHNAEQAAECLRRLRHADEEAPTEAIVVTLRADGGLAVSGMEPITTVSRFRCLVVAETDQGDALELASAELTHPPLGIQPQQHSRSTPLLSERRLCVRGWRPSGVGEALIYCHGFNMNTAYGLESIAQFLALGRLPPRIKPIVFSWPTGLIPSHPLAERMARSEELGNDLAALFQALADSGVRDVHVLTHSMGAQVFLYHIAKIERELQPSPGHSGADSLEGSFEPDRRKMRLASVSLLNPEMSEGDFLQQCLPRLRKLCDHISVYGNADDSALFWSGCFSGAAMLGRLGSAPYRAALSAHAAATPQLEQSVMLTGESNPSELWADIDVIDMTWLDSNQDGWRHNSFNLNRSLIDDLREVIVDRLRAAQRRSRLVRLEGNVYTFLQPPSFIIN